jgi:hypothetical protein
LLGIARAVAGAHAQGIVHRDLKPSNVIIDPSDQPRVLDFGLAKRHRQAADGDEEPLVAQVVEESSAEPDAEATLAPGPVTGLSQTPPATERGAVLGTPSYMAPEQAAARHGEVGPAADVHALGAIFFEMLTGRPPFLAATTLDTLVQVMEHEPPSVRTLNRRVPAGLAALCRRCLAKAPRERYPDAGALADDLEDQWRRAARRRTFARLALAAGVVVLPWVVVALRAPQWAWPNLSAVAALAHVATEDAGPMIQESSVLLAVLVASLVYLLPVLLLTGFVVWSVAWLVTGLRSPARPRRGDAAEPAAEPYLQKLFAARTLTGPKGVEPRRGAAVELADVELGKMLQDAPVCRLRRGKQKSLERPVLVWTAPPAMPGAPAPGVVVRHPSVLSLHAVASGPEGCCLVTENAAASPLAEMLERRRLEPLEAAVLLVKVAHALQAFHDQGARHGRLSPEWLLVQGDLEPLLCPCGVPGQSAPERGEDVRAAARLLDEWLPPRPRRWRRQSLAAVYRVCDAASAGDYADAADLARDLEHAARAAFVRRRQRLANALAAVLFGVPLLVLALLWTAGAVVALGGERPVGLEAFRESFAGHLLALLAPSAVLLGFVHGRVLVHGYRLRLRRGVGWRFIRQRLLIGFRQAALAALVAGAVVAAVAATSGAFQPRLGLLALAALVGFWLLGGGLSALVAFGEFLVGSLRLQGSGSVLEGVGALGLPLATLPSPVEAARTLGGRTRVEPPS